MQACREGGREGHHSGAQGRHRSTVQEHVCGAQHTAVKQGAECMYMCSRITHAVASVPAAHAHRPLTFAQASNMNICSMQMGGIVYTDGLESEGSTKR